jgi:ferredoxin-NADP reductase
VTPATPLRWLPAVIERIERRTVRVVSVFLRAEVQRHIAGQHLDVRLTAPDGYRAQRSYSIASAPGAELFELAIERLEEGEVSPFFHDIARMGDAVEVRGPVGGHFVWRAEDGGPLLLLAGGSGVVPLVSMIRDRSAASPGLPTLLVYSARTWGDLLFRDELIAAEREDAQLAIVLATTRGQAQRPQDQGQRLDGAALGSILERWGQLPRHAYVCGSNRFVEAMTAGLVACDVPAARIRAERYGGTA